MRHVALSMGDNDFAATAALVLDDINRIRLDAYPAEPGGGGPLAAEAAAGDAAIGRLCDLLHAADEGQRVVVRRALTPRHRASLGRYGRRAASLALREGSGDRIRTALVAMGLSDLPHQDTLALGALHHHCARRLAAPAVTSDWFATAAVCAAPRRDGVFRELGRRQAVSPVAFGWLEQEGPEGVTFARADDVRVVQLALQREVHRAFASVPVPEDHEVLALPFPAGADVSGARAMAAALSGRHWTGVSPVEAAAYRHLLVHLSAVGFRCYLAAALLACLVDEPPRGPGEPAPASWTDVGDALVWALTDRCGADRGRLALLDHPQRVAIGAVLNHLEARWDTTEPVARAWP